MQQVCRSSVGTHSLTLWCTFRGYVAGTFTALTHPGMSVWTLGLYCWQPSRRIVQFDCKYLNKTAQVYCMVGQSCIMAQGLANQSFSHMILPCSHMILPCSHMISHFIPTLFSVVSPRFIPMTIIRGMVCSQRISSEDLYHQRTVRLVSLVGEGAFQVPASTFSFCVASSAFCL